MGMKPAEVLFIDDSPQHVEGAKLAGLNAVLYEPGKPLAPYFS
jgi:HAD superfamily hydrolase (TIGR01509 family)